MGREGRQVAVKTFLERFAILRVLCKHERQREEKEIESANKERSRKRESMAMEPVAGVKKLFLVDMEWDEMEK